MFDMDHPFLKSIDEMLNKRAADHKSGKRSRWCLACGNSGPKIDAAFESVHVGFEMNEIARKLVYGGDNSDV